MRIAVLLALLLLPSVLHAQTTVRTGMELVWDQDQTTAAEAQTFSYRYFVDGATTGDLLAGVTCAGAPVVCRAPVPAFTLGAHTITLAAENGYGGSLPSTPLDFRFVVVPSQPRNPRFEPVA